MPQIDHSPPSAGPPEPPPAGPPGTPAPTRRRLRILAFGVIPALFCGVLVVGLIRTNTPKAVQGQAAPAFTVPLLGGGSLSSAALGGRPVVVNFFASWCTPCIQEAPTLEALFKQYQAQGVQVIGVDYEDIPTDAQDFVHRYGITYPVLQDPDGTLATAFGVHGVPETYFLDRQYRFFSIGQGDPQGSRSGTRILGAVTRPVMTAQIQALLASVAPTPPAP